MCVNLHDFSQLEVAQCNITYVESSCQYRLPGSWGRDSGMIL